MKILALLVLGILLCLPARAKEDAEIAGRFLNRMAKAEAGSRAEREEFIGKALCSTRNGPGETRHSKTKFISIWEANLQTRRITGMETSRKGDMLTVDIHQQGTLEKLHHRLVIDMLGEPALMAICLEAQIPQSNNLWVSKSLMDAEAQFLQKLSEQVPTWRDGKTKYQEGPELESAEFPIVQDPGMRGMALVIRKKTNGETIGEYATQRHRENRPADLVLARREAAEKINASGWLQNAVESSNKKQEIK